MLDLLWIILSHFKERKLGFLREKMRRRRRRRRRREEEEINKFPSWKSSGVIPIKVCEFFVWVDPFPHTPSSFYDLRKDWNCC